MESIHFLINLAVGLTGLACVASVKLCMGWKAHWGAKLIAVVGIFLLVPMTCFPLAFVGEQTGMVRGYHP